MRRIISICKEVPLLPIAIIAAIPLALLGSWRPWEAAGVSLTFGPFNPGVGQWIVIALVVYTIVVTVIGMIDDLRHGHVGVDLLAVIAIASTVAVQEYWAAWAVVLMISSGEAMIEVATKLKELKARRIFVCTCFGLFCNGLEAFDKAYESGLINKVFTTNLIYRTPELKQREWYVEVDLSKYISYVIDTLNHDTSVSKLLDPKDRINNLLVKKGFRTAEEVK